MRSVSETVAKGEMREDSPRLQGGRRYVLYLRLAEYMAGISSSEARTVEVTADPQKVGISRRPRTVHLACANICRVLILSVKLSMGFFMLYQGTTRKFPKPSQRVECVWTLRDYAEDDDPILYLCFAAYVAENNSSVARLGEAIAGAGGRH